MRMRCMRLTTLTGPALLLCLHIHATASQTDFCKIFLEVSNCECRYGTCGDSEYVGVCSGECPGSYYRARRFFPSVCDPTVPQTNNPTSQVSHPPSRKRRQAPSGTNGTSVVLTTTTTTTTTASPEWVCEKCSVEGCAMCKDSEEEPQCEKCQEGYLLNNINFTCTSPVSEELQSLSVGAIVGIVIGVLCVVGLAITVSVILLKRYSASRKGGADMGRTQPNTNQRNRSDRNANPISKINAQEVKKKHDEITRYVTNPTLKKTSDSEDKYHPRAAAENSVLESLGVAPGPPDSNDYIPMQQSQSGYDVPVPGRGNDGHFYTDFQNQEEELYLNTAAAEKSFKANESFYANEQQQTSAKKASSTPVGSWQNTGNHCNKPLQPQESLEFYEPVMSAAEDTQEIYMNDDSAALVQNGQDVAEEIYLNEGLAVSDDVYQNLN